MTLHQFKCLNQHKQFEALKEKGVIIADRIGTVSKYLLYQIEGFYVELRLNLYESKILTMKCFFDTKELEPYLVDIKLPEIK